MSDTAELSDKSLHQTLGRMFPNGEHMERAVRTNARAKRNMNVQMTDRLHRKLKIKLSLYPICRQPAIFSICPCTNFLARNAEPISSCSFGRPTGKGLDVRNANRGKSLKNSPCSLPNLTGLPLRQRVPPSLDLVDDVELEFLIRTDEGKGD